MENILSHQEQRNQNRSKVISVAVHIGLILLALLPLLHYPDPPPGQEGILVNLGLPDQGQGDDNAGPATPSAPEPEVEEEEPTPEPEVSEPVVEDVREPEPTPERDVVKTEDPNEIALKRKREEERKKRDEADRREREREQEEARKRAEADAKRRAEAAEAQRRAEAEAKQKAEADALKNQIGGLFGEGSGKGNTGKPGNQGDPNGDPDASKLDGISTGSGKVGGGLGSRGVLRSPTVSENSQKAGTVVISVCVDADGDIVSAEYTQRGSTTADSQLVAAAVRNAKNWQFSKGSVDKQCGTITYNFKVR